MVTILNAEPEDYSDRARAILEEFATVDEEAVDRRELLRTIHDYDAVIVRLGHTIDSRVIQKAKNLRAIATATTGLNHIDVEFARDRGIEVISLREEREFLDSIYATAEHTLALLLAVLRNLPQAVTHVSEGNWNRDAFKGRELQGSTLGIVGYGRLGSKLARYGDALGMDVLAYDPHVEDDDQVQLVEFETLLTKSDYVTIHVPYTESTAGIIGKEELDLMKRSGYLVNTSRGEIIDEEALVSALQRGEIEGAAVDVVQGEYNNREKWSGDSLLIRYAKENQNLIITPHIGGATWESMEKTEIFIAEKLKRQFEAMHNDSDPV